MEGVAAYGRESREFFNKRHCQLFFAHAYFRNINIKIWHGVLCVSLSK